MLEKSLKTFNKRLEKLQLESSNDSGLISSIPSTNALISELLAQLQSHPMLEEESSSSSSSDSSEEDEPRMDKRDMKQERKMQDRKAQMQQLINDAGMGPRSAQIPPSPAAAATSSAGVLGMAPPTQSSFSSLLQQQRLEDSLEMSPSSEVPRVSSSYIAPPPLPSRILVCTGSKCMDRGADEVLDAVTSARNAAGSMAQVVSCKCLGKCKMGPAMRVKPSDGTRSILHTGVTPQSAVGLVTAYLHPADSDPPSSADIIELPVVWDHETLRAPFC
ncbi:MAG: hypothetical protein WDW38_011311 [Sanguina aurantia]